MSNSSFFGRRKMLAAVTLSVATALLLPLRAEAQSDWPSRPIRLIIPFVAGGGTDPLARAIGAKLSDRLGQPVVVENKGGAGGTIGTEFVAKSPGDGYTLLFASTSITTNVASGKQLRYDLGKDLKSIGQVGASPLIVVVKENSPARNLNEFIEIARKDPGSISYGSGGIGAISHLGIELLANESKISLLHVPYKGISPALNDLIGGRVQTLLASPPSVTSYLSGNSVRILAATSAKRSPYMPDVPTVAESGLPGFQLEFWWGLLASAKTPPAIVQKLNEALNWSLSQFDIRDLLASVQATPEPGPPEKLDKLISFELDRWHTLVKEAHIKMN